MSSIVKYGLLPNFFCPFTGTLAFSLAFIPLSGRSVSLHSSGFFISLIFYPPLVPPLILFNNFSTLTSLSISRASSSQFAGARLSSSRRRLVKCRYSTSGLPLCAQYPLSSTCYTFPTVSTTFLPLLCSLGVLPLHRLQFLSLMGNSSLSLGPCLLSLV